MGCFACVIEFVAPFKHPTRVLYSTQLVLTLLVTTGPVLAADLPRAFPADPNQALERTCFQTGRPWSAVADLRSDVAIVYGIDPGLPQRIASWREHGYRIHVMTGVAWGGYQDYLYGRFDGINHEDEAQTDAAGNKVSHGGDVYYMCPGTNYGKFLCVGVQRALDAGAEAIHLEEPEFWVRSGYSEGFKREWRAYYGEDWQAPQSSVEAQWRASKLKYFLYRRALQQVFDYVQAYNHRTGRRVRCYVATHSLLNYASWGIVSPESSLARLQGCDGYIAQVWTGTARTPNLYRGQLRERTFETAFLEYGVMQNLVRSTGRQVWYLNDPVEDNPGYDWSDYRTNWESTLVASLFQPEVWHYEVAPWPERVFGGRYPRRGAEREAIPPSYATELQTVMNSLNDMRQKRVSWDCGTTGIGVLVSDSLMFERGQPQPSEPHLSQVYGLALPLLKRGMPVTPVQLENVTVRNYLAPFRLLLLSYQGMKPLGPEVHRALAEWVRRGGVLVVCDDDSDPFNHIREWWNSDGRHYATPREDLFAELGLPGGNPGNDKVPLQTGALIAVGKGGLFWLQKSPTQYAAAPDGDLQLVRSLKPAAARAGLNWQETNYLLLRRGPYVLAAGLDESVQAPPKVLHGRLVDLFDPGLLVRTNICVGPGSRFFLLDLEAWPGRGPQVLASACKALPAGHSARHPSWTVEGVADTPAVVLLRVPRQPHRVTLAGEPISECEYSAADHLLWVRFTNRAEPRELALAF